MPGPDLTAHLFVTVIECFETVYSNKGRVLNVWECLFYQALLLMNSEILSKRALVNFSKVSRQN